MLNKKSPKNNFDFNKLVDQERNKDRLYFIPEGIPLGKEWKETSMNNHELKKLKKKTQGSEQRLSKPASYYHHGLPTGLLQSVKDAALFIATETSNYIDNLYFASLQHAELG